MNITRVHARRVWDSRGCPTIEVEVHCGGVMGRVIAAAGKSIGAKERPEQRDGGTAHGGMDVRKGVDLTNALVASRLVGMPVEAQAEIDALLLDEEGMGAQLGTNVTTAVSLAVLAAASAARDVPLWASGEQHPARLPVPEIQIFGGGQHAGRALEVQDFMVCSPSAGSFSEALDRAAEVFRAAGGLLQRRGLQRGLADEGGYWPALGSNEAVLDLLVEAILAGGLVPGEDVWISLDIAASSFGRPERYPMGGQVHDTDDFVGLLSGWLEKYPILCVEDPFHEDDDAGFERLSARWGGHVQIIGDDFLASRPDRIRRAGQSNSCNSVIVKPWQAGSVSRTLEALDTASDSGLATILSGRSGDSEDVTVAQLAVGWDVGQIKVGGIARSERCAKWNELLRIEEAIGSDAAFAGAEMLARFKRGSPVQ